jgi:glycosyltransferase involved in cell wall biosynthesis
VVVPSEWARDMFRAIWGSRVLVWPVGIDTKHWSPDSADTKTIDLLIYDKLNNDRTRLRKELLDPIQRTISSQGFSCRRLRWGYYREATFEKLVRASRAVVYLSEYETQGIAYQQALSCNVPVLAWEPCGAWTHPDFYPIVQYRPVFSAPYWDDRCGLKFRSANDFARTLRSFMAAVGTEKFRPREYIIESLTIEACTRRFVGLYDSVFSE